MGQFKWNVLYQSVLSKLWSIWFVLAINAPNWNLSIEVHANYVKLCKFIAFLGNPVILLSIFSFESSPIFVVRWFTADSY